MSGFSRIITTPVRLAHGVRRLAPAWLRRMTNRDVSEIVAYMSGELSPDAESRTVERMQYEPEFRRKALTLMHVRSQAREIGLNLTVEFPAAVAYTLDETGRAPTLPREQMASAYASVRERLGLPARAFEEYERDLETIAAMPDAVRDALSEALPSNEEIAADYRRGRFDAQVNRLAHKIKIAAVIIVTTLIGGFAHDIYAVRAQAGRQVQEVTQHRASTAFMPDPTVRETSDEWKRVSLDNGTTVMLKTKSRLSVSGAELALDGAAEVSVPAGAGTGAGGGAAFTIVHTAVAKMVLVAGRYDIDAPIGGAATVVTVDSGVAHVMSNATSSDGDQGGIDVRKGQRAKITPTTATIVK